MTVRVTDTGPGLDADAVDQFFEPSFSKTRDGRGHGPDLALANAYAIIRQSDGRIAVTSTPGAPTIVTIALPRVLELESRVSPRMFRGTREPFGFLDRWAWIMSGSVRDGGREYPAGREAAMVRRPVVAGSFYAGTRERLRAQLEGCPLRAGRGGTFWRQSCPMRGMCIPDGSRPRCTRASPRRTPG